jgi:PPK2 family polyphosphate:nucleotide phosphotransferase
MKPEKLASIAKTVRVDKPDGFRVKDIDPAGKLGLDLDKDDAKKILPDLVEAMAKQQERLYAEGKSAVLAIVQAMDAAGKDTVIEHVFSGINPQGCQVTSFKQPSAEELSHDFLWRTTKCLPPRGHIGVFNRSYYEEVLVVRVHPDWLAKQKLPAARFDKKFWDARYESINALERHLTRNGTKVLKFHLRISKEEQRQRFLDRLKDPEKNWKFSLGDLPERELWNKYMDAYEHMIRATSTEDAPWHVIPADHKWTARVAVAAVILDAMNKIAPKAPEVPAAQLLEFAKAQKALEAEAPKKPAEKSDK